MQQLGCIGIVVIIYLLVQMEKYLQTIPKHTLQGIGAIIAVLIIVNLIRILRDYYKPTQQSIDHEEIQSKIAQIEAIRNFK